MEREQLEHALRREHVLVVRDEGQVAPRALLVVGVLPPLVLQVAAVARQPQLLGVGLRPEVVEAAAADGREQEADEDDLQGVRGDDQAPSAATRHINKELARTAYYDQIPDKTWTL